MGYAEDKTEEELIGLERAITREYRQAYKSVQMKAAKYFGIFEERDKKMREALKDGTYPKLEGASAWMTPEEHYKQWRLAQIGRGKRWEAVRDDLADSITKANEMAANIVNKKTAGIFGFNYNFSAYEIEKKVGKGVAFNIYNEHAVKELLEGKNHTEYCMLTASVIMHGIRRRSRQPLQVEYCRDRVCQNLRMRFLALWEVTGRLL